MYYQTIIRPQFASISFSGALSVACYYGKLEINRDIRLSDLMSHLVNLPLICTITSILHIKLSPWISQMLVKFKALCIPFCTLLMYSTAPITRPSYHAYYIQIHPLIKKDQNIYDIGCLQELQHLIL